MKDFYSILGVSKDASDADIKKAYRKLSKTYHPDRQGGKSEAEKKEAEAKMKEINEAYEILSDKKKREEYDNPNPFGGNGGGGYSRSPFDADDIHNMWNEFRAASGFGGFDNEPRHPRGADIRIHVKLGIYDILNGCEKKIKYKRRVRCKSCEGKGGAGKMVCPYCHGQGFIEHSKSFGPNQIFTSRETCPHCHGQGFKFKNTCDHCHGTGFEEVEEIVTIKFDKGKTVQGSEFRMVGKGHESPDKDGATGSFVATAIFDFDQTKYNLSEFPNIIHKVKINWIDAMLGGRLNINLEGIGTQIVDVKPCTKPNDTIVLHGKGAKVDMEMYGHQQHIKGDYVLLIEYSVPDTLTEEQTELLKKFKETLRK